MPKGGIRGATHRTIGIFAQCICMTHYIFCFPYRGVGGVPVLFVRMAQWLVQRGHRASVIDYTDGAMAKLAAGTSIALLPYDNGAPVVVPADTVLVFQSLNPWAMYRGIEIAHSARLFFWNCHPFNLVPIFPGVRDIMMARLWLGRFFLATLLRRYRRIVRRFIKFLMARQALVFMDKTNVENTERYLDIDIAPVSYLPVPAGEVCDRIVRPARDWDNDGVRLAWIGRIADFKYPILTYTLGELDRIAPGLGVPLHMTVIGGGEHIDDLARDILGLKNVRVEIKGELPFQDIELFLREKVDVLLGMGTSVLEGARLGIPSILLDVSYGTVPDGYIFTWLQSRDGFTLGEVISPRQSRPGNDSLLQRLREAMTDYSGVSNAAKRHYDHNHAPTAIVDKFLDMTAVSCCFYSDFKSMGFSARDPVYDHFAALRRRFAQK